MSWLFGLTCCVVAAGEQATSMICGCFFFNDTATTEIYTLSLHDALPIYAEVAVNRFKAVAAEIETEQEPAPNDVAKANPDRKSTRLNSSHANISYAVFCLKKNNMIKLAMYA